jgi:hypothetical protein
MQQKLHHLDQFATDLQVEMEKLRALRAEFELLRADFRTIRKMRNNELNLTGLYLNYFHGGDHQAIRLFNCI